MPQDCRHLFWSIDPCLDTIAKLWSQIWLRRVNTKTHFFKYSNMPFKMWSHKVKCRFIFYNLGLWNAFFTFQAYKFSLNQIWLTWSRTNSTNPYQKYNLLGFPISWHCPFKGIGQQIVWNDPIKLLTLWRLYGRWFFIRIKDGQKQWFNFHI